MNIFRSASGVRVQAPAKLNLFFEVLGKRSDGFHEIETLMVPIGLYDEVHFQCDPSGQVMVDCRWAERQTRDSDATLGELPREAENLATRAVLLLRRRANVKDGAMIRLVKRIPSAAGLGGGSSDAAAALVAANLGWNLGWSRDQLATLAAELGSDVPFFLLDHAAICRGRGERIEPIAGIGTWHAVVVRPPAGLSTAAVYGCCKPSERPASVAPLVDAMRRGAMCKIAQHLCNRLEPAAEQLSPWIGRLQQEFQQINVQAAQMSGSGSSYFGVCRSARHARRVASALRARNVGRVFVVRVDT